MHGWKAGLIAAIAVLGSLAFGIALAMTVHWLPTDDQSDRRAGEPAIYTGSDGITVRLSRGDHLVVYTADGARYDFFADKLVVSP